MPMITNCGPRLGRLRLGPTQVSLLYFTIYKYVSEFIAEARDYRLDQDVFDLGPRTSDLGQMSLC
jgi:hypothetical protein